MRESISSRCCAKICGFASMVDGIGVVVYNGSIIVSFCSEMDRVQQELHWRSRRISDPLDEIG